MLKRTFFAITLLIIAWHGHSQEKPIVTLEMKDVPLRKMITQLEQQTDYSFIYNETIDLNQEKSIRIKKQKIETALKLIFDQTNIEWKINNKHITLSNKKHEPITQKVTISGYITDVESSEVLIGANVFDKTSNTGTVSNEFGFFSLTLPPGEAELRFSYTGYAMEMQKMNLTENKKINIRLKTNLQLEEVVVTGKEYSESGINATQMSIIDVPLNIIKTTPVLLGEADPMKTLQMLPGVQAGTEGSAGLYVRGGNIDENLVLLDGIPLYNVDHVFGFFSIFTPEAIKKITLFKGSFPARFSGRLSSVIDVRTNDGDMHNYHGMASIGLLSSKIQLEGPIRKGRTSFNISARRSYIDLLSKPFLSENDKYGYYFYDLNAKINHKFNDKDRLFISLYNGRDRFNSEMTRDYDDSKWGNESRTKWGNTLLAARWSHIFSPKLFSNTTWAFTKYNFNATSDYHYLMKDANTDHRQSSEYCSGIQDLTGKIDFDYYPSPKYHIKFGAGYQYHNFKPEIESSRIRNNEEKDFRDTTYTSQSNSRIYANEISVYAENNYSITPHLSINAGINLSAFNVRNTSYTSLQPRLSVRYQPVEKITFKASYTKMNQYIHLLSGYTINLPMDLWVPATERIKPMRAHQYSLGTYYTGIKGWELSMEAYYKDMRNVLEYKDGATFLGSSYNWEEKVEMGKGRAYGIELMAQKNIGKLTGWVAYTLAKSERKFSEDGINNGNWFPYKYDRRHHLNIVLNYKFSDRIDVGASWEFYTGGTTTIGEEKTFLVYPQETNNGSYYDGNSSYFSRIHFSNEPEYNGSPFKEANYIYGRNNYRMPPSHRLNVGINFHKKKKHGERIWSFGIFNVYNAMNPMFIYRDFESSRKNKIKKVTFFPIIPSVTYTYKF